MPSQKKVLEVSKDNYLALEGRARAMRGLVGRQLEQAPPERRRKLDAAVGHLGEEPMPGGEARVVALEGEQTINGMRANGFQVTDQRETVRGWVTSDKPELQQIFRQLEKIRDQTIERKSAVLSAKEALSSRGVPVRVQTLGGRTYTWEDLIEVEEKPLSDDLFAAPAGFERTTGKVPESPNAPPPAQP